MLLMTSGLVAYSQVFVATVSPFLAPLLPSDGDTAADDERARLPAVALYSAVVIPLSCFDLAEQVRARFGREGLAPRAPRFCARAPDRVDTSARTNPRPLSRRR